MSVLPQQQLPYFLSIAFILLSTLPNYLFWLVSLSSSTFQLHHQSIHSYSEASLRINNMVLLYAVVWFIHIPQPGGLVVWLLLILNRNLSGLGPTRSLNFHSSTHRAIENNKWLHWFIGYVNCPWSFNLKLKNYYAWKRWQAKYNSYYPRDAQFNRDHETHFVNCLHLYKMWLSRRKLLISNWPVAVAELFVCMDQSICKIWMCVFVHIY